MENKLFNIYLLFCYFYKYFANLYEFNTFIPYFNCKYYRI